MSTESLSQRMRNSLSESSVLSFPIDEWADEVELLEEERSDAAALRLENEGLRRDREALALGRIPAPVSELEALRERLKNSDEVVWCGVCDQPYHVGFGENCPMCEWLEQGERIGQLERQRKALADFFWVVRGHIRAGELASTRLQVVQLIEDPSCFAAAQDASPEGGGSMSMEEQIDTFKGLAMRIGDAYNWLEKLVGHTINRLDVEQANELLDLLKQERSDAAALRERYRLLADAVNDSDAPCLPECDSYSHAEDCPNMSTAKEFETLGGVISALRERIRLLEQFAESLSGLRKGCLSAYAGGYTHPGDEDKLRIFQHGMNTVCNVVQARLNSLATSPAAASEEAR